MESISATRSARSLRSKSVASRLKLPLSILARSRTSSMSSSSALPLLIMMLRYFRCSVLRSLSASNSAIPSTAFIGVRISCDMLEIKSDLVRDAADVADYRNNGRSLGEIHYDARDKAGQGAAVFFAQQHLHVAHGAAHLYGVDVLAPLFLVDPDTEFAFRGVDSFRERVTAFQEFVADSDITAVGEPRDSDHIGRGLEDFPKPGRVFCERTRAVALVHAMARRHYRDDLRQHAHSRQIEPSIPEERVSDRGH